MSFVNNVAGKYIIIDLEETLKFSIDYLHNSINLKNIDKFKFNIDTVENDIKDLDKFILFISVNDYIKYKNDIVSMFNADFNMFFNSNSFSEMPTSVYKDYLKFIEKFDNIYLYSSNAIRRVDKHNEEDVYFDGTKLLLEKQWNILFNENEFNSNECTFIGYKE